LIDVIKLCGRVSHDDFNTLVKYTEVWDMIKYFITPKFVEFMFDWEFAMQTNDAELELERQDALAKYEEMEQERLMDENYDSDDDYVNNTDWDRDAIDEAFEGDPENTCNVD
jgi:hypothetical protein